MACLKLRPRRTSGTGFRTTLSWCIQLPGQVIGQEDTRRCIVFGAFAYQPPSELISLKQTGQRCARRAVQSGLEADSSVPKEFDHCSEIRDRAVWRVADVRSLLSNASDVATLEADCAVRYRIEARTPTIGKLQWWTGATIPDQ